MSILLRICSSPGTTLNDMMPGCDIWTCQENEPTKAYDAFQKYLDMGPKRSLSELARSGDAGVGLRQLQRYAVEFYWTERARAWDEHCFGLSRKASEDEVLKMCELHTKASRKLIDRGMARLVNLEDDRISPADVARFIVEGIKAERLARGLTTEATSINGKVEHDSSEIVRALQDPAINDTFDQLLAQIYERGGAHPDSPVLPGRVRQRSEPGEVGPSSSS